MSEIEKILSRVFLEGGEYFEGGNKNAPNQSKAVKIASKEIQSLFNTENCWVAYDFTKPETRPTKTGKYFICRKDGKVHWETWNGSGWAYNNNVIVFYMQITPPQQQLTQP